MISNGNDQSGLIMIGACVSSCFNLSKAWMHSSEKLKATSFTRSWSSGVRFLGLAGGPRNQQIRTIFFGKDSDNRLLVYKEPLSNFEADFPAIVYNDALTSNENASPEPTVNMAPLLPRAQRLLWLRYQVDGYTEEIVHDFKLGMETGKTLTDRMRMVYPREEGQVLFSSHAWRKLFEIQGPLVQEFILEFFRTCRISDTKLGLDVADTLCFQLGGPRLAPSYTFIRDPVKRLCHRLISYSISGWGQAPEKVTTTDLFFLRSMDQGTANILYLLAQYLFKNADGRKIRGRMSRGYFIGCLAEHFSLVSDEGLMGLFVISCVLSVMDLHKLVKLNIYVAEGAPDVDEDAQVVPAPVQATQPPLAVTPTRTVAQRLSRLEEEVHNLRGDMGEQREMLDSMAHYFSRFTAWTITSLSLMMDRSGVRYTSYADTRIPYQRHRVK
ncbi:hypothetical protein Tco_0479329 [Tanacetum coccineum]